MMEEEEQSSPIRDGHPIRPFNHRSVVDTSRPFRSVKEAVAIFGERFLVGEVYSSSKSFPLPKNETPLFSDTIKKLENELEETKNEIKLLKEREAETGVVLASLNAELHKNMSKLALAEAAVAAKAAASASSSRSPTAGQGDDLVAIVMRDEEKKRDACWKMEQRHSHSPSLAEILSIGGERDFFVGRTRKKMNRVVKKKPIIPILGDLLSRKKRSSAAGEDPLYASHSHFHWN